MATPNNFLIGALGLAATLGALPSFAAAAPRDASEWAVGHHARARLITAPIAVADKPGRYRAGVHITLDKDWKTYWRMPGSSGVPPYFDWSGSTNLKSVRLFYPAPERHVDEYGASIGYKYEVVFPVEFEAKDPSKPVKLKLAIQYGVCREICIPAEAKLKLDVVASTDASRPAMSTPSSARIARLLQHYLARVPTRTGGDAATTPNIVQKLAKLNGTKPELRITARYPAGTKGADLFIEAPDGIFVPLAERDLAGDGKTVSFKIDLTKGEDPKLLKGKSLTLTLVSEAGHAETTWRLP